jgi:transcriptional regulator with XRE-family HTH domain
MSATTLALMQSNRVGPLLRDWRLRRRLSQMDLALESGISTRHLSFVETGRSKPSQEMLLRLAERLAVPLRERNQLLLAAGYAPQFSELALDDPSMAPVRDAVGRVLQGHEPYPAFAVDAGWNLIASNAALGVLIEGASEELLRPPVNCMRLALHPEGVAPRIINLAEWRAHLLHRLERQLALSGDSRLAELLDELCSYPGADGSVPHADETKEIMVELRLAHGDDRELRFFSTVTTFGTALDVTMSELSIEAFFPADHLTAQSLTAEMALG